MSGIGVWEQGGTASSLWLSGSATRSGLLALAGAQAGVDAPPHALDGDFGAFHAYSGKDRGVLEDHLVRLGEEWATPSVMLQPFSGDTYSQAPLECVRELRQRFGLDRAGESAGSRAAALESLPSAELDHIVVRCDGRTALGVERKHTRYPGSPRRCSSIPTRSLGWLPRGCAASTPTRWVSSRCPTTLRWHRCASECTSSTTRHFQICPRPGSCCISPTAPWRRPRQPASVARSPIRSAMSSWRRGSVVPPKVF